MKIDFEMKVDDNLQTSGLALREVRIETDNNLLTLRRDIREINVSGDDDDLPQMRLFENQNLKISVGLGMGNGTSQVWTCDLTHGYIKINADYRS